MHSGWFDEERVAKRYVLVQGKGPAAVVVVMAVVRRCRPLAVRCRIEASWLVAVLFRAVVDAPVEGLRRIVGDGARLS